MERRSPRLLFDENWYRAHAPAFEGDAYEHFSTIGWRKGFDPHPLFSCAHYLEQVPDLLAGEENPLEHYLSSDAGAKYRPHVLFDPEYYVRRNGIAIGDENPLVHYLTVGGRCGLDPNPFFVSSMYLEASPDVNASQMNPLVHYASSGGAEWRRPPHASFDAQAYALRRRLGAGVNPLAHFLGRLYSVRARELRLWERPDVSVIILNYNKSRLTLQCVVELLDAGGTPAMEVVVVDNGSRADDFAHLSNYLPRGVKLIRLSTNRYFGEGNNIGVEASSGRYVLFLNNDTFVSEGAVEALLAVLESHPDAGAVGPKFLYPDGRLQECGAYMGSCGAATQRGKYLDNQPGRFVTTEPVGYVSAACLLLARELFDRVGGFDHMWDPAYYEDVDLCLKLSLLGRRTYYCADAVVTHVEKATSSDVTHGLSLTAVVPINREKFITRWGDYLERGHDPEAARVRLPSMLDALPSQFAGNAILYTSDPLMADGSTRYLLTIARALSQRYCTYVVTPDRYSTYRLRGIANDLELDVPRVRLLPLSALARFSDCDVFVAMGNEVLPPHAPLGRRRIFVCGTPCVATPDQLARRWGWLDGYDDVVVYSASARRHFEDRASSLTQRVPPVTVLPPPVRIYGDAGAGRRAPGRILSVGQFSSHANGKHQDALVEAFRALIEASARTDLELHLVGNVANDPASHEFYLDVRRRARGLNVRFHLGAPPSVLRELYASSSYYWHAIGYRQSETLFPERVDPFAVPVIEAMSAGTIPLVYAAGGTADVVGESVTGYHWRTPDELVHKMVQVLDAPARLAETMRNRAAAVARRFDQASFEEQLVAFLGPSWPAAPQGLVQVAVRELT